MAKPGRKPGSDGEKSRARLLAAAAAEFALSGYHETKISAIVKKAGVSQPAFYLYFESKEAIFQELTNAFREQLFKHVQASLLAPDIQHASLADAIAAGVAGIFSFFHEKPQLTHIGLCLSPEAEAIKEELAKRIQLNLEKEQQMGYFSADIDMSMAAESLVGTLVHFGTTPRLQKEPAERAKEFVQLFLNGLMNREG